MIIYKQGERVLLIAENEEVIINEIEKRYVIIQDKRGWFGKRKYNEIKKIGIN